MTKLSQSEVNSIAETYLALSVAEAQIEILKASIRAIKVAWDNFHYEPDYSHSIEEPISAAMELIEENES